MRAQQLLASRHISVYHLGNLPIQSCGQSVSAPRGKARARLNAHTELRTKRQRSAREVVYRNRPIVPGPTMVGTMPNSPMLHQWSVTFLQGLTLVHCSAQRKRFVWNRGCIMGLFRGCLRGV
jgi:hypothetical protein